jgi:2-polyprenyl-3-methyl-5-hydroxy-6-metoxy-1,4-benzoquinol methylase
MVGCGNSKLSEEMALDGYSQITNIDISTNVIEKMSAIYSPRFAM